MIPSLSLNLNGQNLAIGNTFSFTVYWTPLVNDSKKSYHNPTIKKSMAADVDLLRY